MSQTLISESYAALETVLKANLPNVKVQALTAADFDLESGKIIAKPPAVLLVFRREELAAQNQAGLLYESRQSYLAICGAENLRGVDEERMGALELLSRVCDVLARAKLQLTATPEPVFVALRRVELAQMELDGTWYSLEVELLGYSSYTGVAA